MPKLGLGLSLPQTRVASAPLIPSSGLSLWLKADAGVTLSGANVTSWADQSGNGNNATAAGSYRPTFVSTDAQFNNKPSILFDGVGNSFVIPSINFNINSNNSIFVAFRVSDGAGGTFLTQGGAGNYILAITDNQFNISNSNTDGIMLAGFVLDNTKNIASATNNNYNFTLYQNGSQVGDTTFYNDFANDGTKMFIGGDSSDVNSEQASSYWLNGKIAEIIVYNRAVTTPERQKVEAYLMDKYAIAPAIVVATTTNVIVTFGDTSSINYARSDYPAYTFYAVYNPTEGISLQRLTFNYDVEETWALVQYSSGEEGGLVIEATNPSTNPLIIPPTGWTYTLGTGPTVTITTA